VEVNTPDACHSNLRVLQCTAPHSDLQESQCKACHSIPKEIQCSAPLVEGKGALTQQTNEDLGDLSRDPQVMPAKKIKRRKINANNACRRNPSGHSIRFAGGRTSFPMQDDVRTHMPFLRRDAPGTEHSHSFESRSVHDEEKTHSKSMHETTEQKGRLNYM
jgi:hypothetical protein